MCKYKRLEQLSGASPQTQPGFGFQLAAGGFRGPKQHWWGGRSPALQASLTSIVMRGGRPIRHHCQGPLQLAAFIPAQMQHEGMLVPNLWLWVRGGILKSTAWKVLLEITVFYTYLYS